MWGLWGWCMQTVLGQLCLGLASRRCVPSSPALRDMTSPCGRVGEFVPQKPHSTEHTTDVGEERGPGQDAGPSVRAADRF